MSTSSTSKFCQVQLVDRSKKPVGHLRLEFDSQDQLEKFVWQWTGDDVWAEYVKVLESRLKGLGLEKLENFSSADLADVMNARHLEAANLYPIPLIALKKALRKYRGEINPLLQYKNEGDSSLLCRCFAVFKKQLENWLDEHSQARFTELQAETLAGTGCSRCLPQLRDLYASRTENLLEKYRCVKDKTPASWALEIQAYLDNRVGSGQVLGFEWGGAKVSLDEKYRLDLQRNFPAILRWNWVDP